MSLAERRWLRLFTLCALFFAQGIPWGFLAITMPAYLSSHGFKEQTLGLVYAMSYWPYVFKWLGGPLIDLVQIPRLGRRRPWIIFAQAMMAATAAALIAVHDPAKSVGLLVVLVLTHTVFNALQNVAVDALAIDLLDRQERGRANGFMYGAKYAGGIVGASGLGFVLGKWGFTTAILVQVILLGAILLLPLLVHERSGPPPERPKASEVLDILGRVYRLRSPWFAAVAMLAMNIAGGVVSVVAPVLYIQHLHWKPDEYSEVVGGPGLLVGFAGASLAGIVADKLGHRRLAALASLLMASGWLIFAMNPDSWNERSFIYVLAIFEPLAQSMMIVALWSVCMGVSLKKTAATQFAAYTSLTSLAQIIGSQWLAGRVRDALDYQGIYLAAAIFQAATIAFLFVIDPEQVRRELPDS